MGLARVLPDVTVYAWDIAPDAREDGPECRDERVGDKIIVAADFDPAVLSDYTDGFPLIICDIEVLSSNIWIPPGFRAFGVRHDCRGASGRQPDC